ncbi:hypothetical protein PRIPAC_91173 [Pristionchus pacificus]|uniref:Membrane protein BRI3 n=1 Tax=Pristionchus pacificus TaxID=54126 RepID=A0A454XIZ6_PRIPA|nr:hypothetical protein PRIPAC_91173 [Pristionchus pacificus]|eukprot:PDM81390.1 hypothetical protein PRIPAC_35266 [Pristionchus pacificus]
MEKVPLSEESDTRAARAPSAPSAPPIEHVTPLQQSAADPPQNPPRNMPMYPQMPVEEHPSSSVHQQGFSSMAPPPAYDEALSMPQQLPQAPADWSTQQNGGAFPPMPMPTHLPQPPPQPPQPTTIIVTNGHVVPGRCEHCSGPLEMHRDTGMLIFIILCLIFCCPIGIFMLCCVPCTNQRRCAVCHRPG